MIKINIQINSFCEKISYFLTISAIFKNILIKIVSKTKFVKNFGFFSQWRNELKVEVH
jgi:hypothetical protein